ncbi:MAG: DNA topoisomerase IB [Chloroflexota bacterium]|nr:DNA topoisomerase IB [Chloroflexota bacterium]
MRAMAIPGAEMIDAAKEAGLRYVSDDRPGIRRKRSGKGFTYLNAKGEAIADASEITRIKRVAIPPAWIDVWICADARGHLQATGRDARGRKQYRYHERFREVRDESKYERMIDFAKALPKIRARVDEDLGAPGLVREKVLATIVRLLETTLIRVGNEEYARDNESYGLTTMLGKHVSVDGSMVRFRFRGKSGKEHDVGARDRRVARIIKALQEMPGQELFSYVDEDGEVRRVDSDDVNAYLREIAGLAFTAKDFRTWAGTVQAALLLGALAPVENVRVAKKNFTAAVERVSARLGNTPAVCRKCYIHPAIVEAYLAGELTHFRDGDTDAEVPDDALGSEEKRVLRFLERHLQRGTSSPRAA